MSDYAIASAITDKTPELAAVLKLTGLLEWRRLDADPANKLSRSFVRKGLRLDRLKDLFKDPPGYLAATLGWGSPTFDPTDFFNLVADFFPEESDIEVGTQGGDPFIRGCILVRRDRSGPPPPGLLATLATNVSADVTQRSAATENWDAGVESSFRIAGGVSAGLRPPLNLKLQPLSGQVAGEVRGFFERNPAKRPFDILGGTGLLTIAATNLQAGVGLTAQWDGSAAHVNPLIYGNLDGVTVKVGSADADGFIATLLGSADIEGNFDLGLEWQADTGLRITASGGIQISLPIHKEIGPIELDVIYLGLTLKNDGTLSLETSAGLSGSLGPLSVTVDRVGALFDLRFAQGTDAKYGPVDLGFGFKPPNGVGLSIDAGVVKGGGYLCFDPDRGEYAGALELAIADFLTVKAIGADHHEDAGRVDGLLAADHHHRGVRRRHPARLRLHAARRRRPARPQPRDAARGARATGVRTGAIDSIMFPQDVDRQRAADHQRPAGVLPAAGRHVPDRPDGQARLGHADADQPVARRHHRDSARQHRDPRRAARSRCRPRTSR